MNSVLADMLQTKRALAADGKSEIAVHSNISLDEGQMLQRLIAARKPKVTLEVGLAFGISALFICEALREVTPNPKHIVIDPAQHADAYWKGVGLASLQRAGYRDFVEFIEKPSQIALPELISAGRKIDFAFIDGEHLFDHALVDFFFVDQLINIGGVVVLDDTGWPSIRALARFIATNRAYKVVDQVGDDNGPRNRLPRDEKPEVKALDQRLGLAGECIAFEKLGNDERDGKHFVAF